MSFSKPQLTNPSKKFIEWSSDNACFTYFDKDRGEKGEKVLLSLPVFFIVLDELSTISGFCEKHGTNIFANEVRSTAKEPLLVRTFKGGERLQGLYNDIKSEAKELGGKYTKSVYAMLLTGKGQEPELVNIKLRGAACSAWIEKKINTGKAVICVKEVSREKKGKTEYAVPVFSATPLTQELTDLAIAMDQVLQEYLREYFEQMEEKIIEAGEAAPEPQPAYVADADARLRQIVSNATHAPNPLLDAAGPARRQGGKAPAITSDPALLEEGPRNIDPEDLDPGVDDLPF
jgi:hypothetical protein